MNRSNATLKAIFLLIGAALALGACADGPGYGSTYAYDHGYPAYDYPAYGSLEFGYWDGWDGDWHRHWDHDPHDHDRHGDRH